MFGGGRLAPHAWFGKGKMGFLVTGHRSATFFTPCIAARTALAACLISGISNGLTWAARIAGSAAATSDGTGNLSARERYGEFICQRNDISFISCCIGVPDSSDSASIQVQMRDLRTGDRSRLRIQIRK